MGWQKEMPKRDGFYVVMTKCRRMLVAQVGVGATRGPRLRALMFTKGEVRFSGPPEIEMWHTEPIVMPSPPRKPRSKCEHCQGSGWEES